MIISFVDSWSKLYNTANVTNLLSISILYIFTMPECEGKTILFNPKGKLPLSDLKPEVWMVEIFRAEEKEGNDDVERIKRDSHSFRKSVLTIIHM